MDDYLMNLLLATHLLKYLLKPIPWEYQQESTNRFFKEISQRSQISLDICEAVCTIWQKNVDDIQSCYMELRQRRIEDKEAFSKYAVSAADFYFSEGYSHGSFLGYCAVVLGVACSYFQSPTNGIPEVAAEVIAFVLYTQQLNGQFHEHDGWDGLCKTSMLFNDIEFPEDQTVPKGWI